MNNTLTKRFLKFCDNCLTSLLFSLHTAALRKKAYNNLTAFSKE